MFTLDEGTIREIMETDVKSEKFSVRNLVVDIDGDMGVQHVQFQAINRSCGILDAFQVGDSITLQFKLQGREWTGQNGIPRIFNSLNIDSIQRIGAPMSAPPERSPTGYFPEDQVAPSVEDEVPF